MLIPSHLMFVHENQTAIGRSRTALIIAASQGHDKVVSHLLAKGASPRIGDNCAVS